MHRRHQAHQARLFTGGPDNQAAGGSDGAQGAGQARGGVIEQLRLPLFHRAIIGLERRQAWMVLPVLGDALTVGCARGNQQAGQLAFVQQLGK
ncbi:hypothetical protein D3C86_2007290 [compost metagenome]